MTNLTSANINYYVAQEWLKGSRYCSYSVVRDSRVVATGLYPVLETIDGSSSVYFQQKSHKGIYSYIENFVGRLRAIGYSFSGQVAFDFVEIGERLVIIDCNPRSTSGLHLGQTRRTLHGRLQTPYRRRLIFLSCLLRPASGTRRMYKSAQVC